jgi:glutamate/tyrosine decarboxylase-like PLP-dependent enzyme
LVYCCKIAITLIDLIVLHFDDPILLAQHLPIPRAPANASDAGGSPGGSGLRTNAIHRFGIESQMFERFRAAAFIADATAHRASMSSDAAYLTHEGDARNPLDWTPEWSRRARAFSTYAALRQLGRNGVSELVERCCQHAHSLVMEIGGLPGAQVVSEPVINQGLVRFLDPAPGASETDHDRRTEEVIAAILASGEAFFGGTTWRGRRAMRVSVSNWLTSREDVRRVVTAVARVLVAKE